MQTSCVVTPQLTSAFVFATKIVQSLYFLNPKFEASSHLVWAVQFVLDLVGNPEESLDGRISVFPKSEISSL